MRDEEFHIFTPFDPTLYKLPINFTFLYVYCGLITVALLTVAPFLRRSPYLRMLFLLTLISAIWMLGDTTPIYPFVFRRLPDLIRGALYAEYALMAFCLFAALTSAVTLERVTARVPKWRRRLRCFRSSRRWEAARCVGCRAGK